MTCRELIEHANTKDYREWTPLHEAAYNGYLDICKLLLENGADLCQE